MVENEIFELIKGDTYERNIIIEKYTSEISQMFFSVKSKETDKRVILQKSLDNGITLMDIDDDKRTYQIFIDSTDTDNMKTGDYFFDVEIITPTNIVVTVLDTDIFLNMKKKKKKEETTKKLE